MTEVAAILERIRAEEVRTVDFRFTDLRGQWQHVAVAADAVGETLLERGVMFDGSAVAGWRDISQSDMLLKPDLATAVSDPFSAPAELDPDLQRRRADHRSRLRALPRSVAERAETHLAASGLADRILVAPQAEFCVFDDVASPSPPTKPSSRRFRGGRLQLRHATPMSATAGIGRTRARLVVPPIEYMADLRAEMAAMLATMGLDPRQQHHDTAPSQSTIAIGADGLVRSADRMQIYKYVVRSVAHSYGKSATSCPSRWRSSRARACRSSRRWRADRCSPARAMVTSATSVCTTSAASCIMRVR